MRQFGGIIIVSVAFVTIIGKSLTLGSLNKSVCVNISTIFARDPSAAARIALVHARGTISQHLGILTQGLVT